MSALHILRVGPGVTVQDKGRPGYLAQGLSRGGALDLLALAEGAALLGHEGAALEIAGSFATLRLDRPARIALTGAPMRALCDGKPLVWQASHALPTGSVLDLSGSAGGVSYLHVAGGIGGAMYLGAVSAHLAAGLGQMVQAGDTLPLGSDPGGPAGLSLTPKQRFAGGMLRMTETPQTRLFPPALRDLFVATTFRKDTRGNRMGQRLIGAEGFALDAGLNILSQPITPGDIQITGDGAPFVLLAECQTTGGYPRIGTVLPCDLPLLVQAPSGAPLRLVFVTLDQAIEAERKAAVQRARLRAGLHPLVRDPHTIPDLLAYQLVSGVTCGDDLERNVP